MAKLKVSTPELLRRVRRRMASLDTHDKLPKFIDALRRAGVVEEFRRGKSLFDDEATWRSRRAIYREEAQDAVREATRRTK